MNAYSIALFVHIAGSLGFFAALGQEWAGLRQLGMAAAPEQVRAMLPAANGVRKFAMASMLAMLATGLYMAFTVWGAASWIVVTLGALFLGVALSVALTGPRMAAVARALTFEHSPMSPALRGLLNHPLLWVSLRARVAIALGIVFLKVARPDLGVSLLVIAAAVALGAASAVLPAFARRQAQPAH